MLSADLNESLSTSRETCLQVLRYWHQLEFFTPFNLDDALSRGELEISLSLASLQGEKANSLLPWLSKTRDLFHYQLYLLPFDKKELTHLSTRFFPLEFQHQNVIELEETLDDEGLTCFARLFIDKNGCPQWSGLSVSTLPWAMGMLQSGEYGQLSQANYDRDMTLIQSALKILENQCGTSNQDDKSKYQFDAPILINLLKILCQWARYSPDYPFVVKVKPIPAKQEASEAPTIKALPSNLPATQNAVLEDPPTEEEEDEPLDILNSFFIRDMEKTLNHLANDNHPILESYINGCDDKCDILTLENQSLLFKHLQPNQLNFGRWPVPNNNIMSLMQQLCINQCFDSVVSKPILATNGPPGTGKTTLLKEIIAENIVQRAKILAGFPTVKACFGERKKIVVGDKEMLVSTLKPELTGFEMLVVSSNNTAVENITRELPLKSKLAIDYQESCQYLRSVATKLSSNHFKQSIYPLQPSLKPWGLIAVALGNSANRQEFIERFFFSPESKSKSADRVQKGECLTIWEWRDHYKGCNFAQAKTAYMRAWTAVENYREQLQELASLHEQVLNNIWTKQIAKQQLILTELDHEIISLVREIQRFEHTLNQVEQHKDILYREIDQQLRFKPAWWKRLLRLKETKLFQQVIQNLQTRRLQLTEELLKLQVQIAESSNILLAQRATHSEVSQQIRQYQKQQDDANEKYQQLKAKFPQLNLPGNDITDQDQINSYWQTEQFNQLRSNLFIQALQLHQAWLAEALKRKYFGGNLFALNALLEGKHPLASSDELTIWQSLFMMIPVVSSTFASIARQFKNLGSQSLGWLLIDEAGQAIPQAAIGAFWRCKKAIVVGDPRQIEPIMTLPPHLIEGVAKHHFSSPNPHWLPHMTSIQRLADLASPLGSIMQQTHEQEWIGIPLLVHRRCLDPMFSVANEIAYENKMINARIPNAINQLQLPSNTWFDVNGIATDKQFVPEQGKCLLQLFIWFYNHDQGLPRLFIITPFKRVQKHLKTLIQNQDNWIAEIDPQLTIPTSRDLQQWLHKHIGTVHTFQGKENEKVIFVLGADKEQKGAIRWASSKPNLLNVALTRATDRIYIIGEWELWANKPYFSQISAVLERKKE